MNILRYIKINLEETLSSGSVFLIEKPRVYENYEEGVKTGTGGLAYNCLCESLNYEKLVVKIPGSTVPKVKYDGEPVPVVFEGLEGKLWQDFSNKGEVRISATAKSVMRIEEKVQSGR